MRIEDAYIELYNSYRIASPGQTVVCGREDVAGRLRCTERNANLVLRRMELHGFIHWQAGRGRGHRSRLTFLMSKDDIMMGIAKARVRQGKLHEGFRMMEERSLERRTKHEFLDWVFEQFGFAEVPSSETIHGDVLRIPFYRSLSTLSPLFVTRRTEAHVVHQVFDTLVRVNPHTQQVEAHLAHHHECDAAYKSWRFYLRKGVLFHDGRQATAYDAAHTLHQLSSIDGPHRPLFQGVSEIRVWSERELEVRLAEPDAMFPHLLAQTAASIQPRGQGNDAEARDILVGTGPFSLRRTDESMVVLEAFPGYFLGRPQLDRIEIWMLPEEPKTERELNKSGARYAARLLDDDVTDATWRQMQSIETGSKYLTFNFQKQGPQQQPGFRAMVAQVLDPQVLLAETGRDNPVARSFVPPTDPTTIQDSNTVALAIESVEQGDVHYNGETLRLLTYDMPSNLSDAKWIEERLKARGIRVEVKVVSAAQIDPESLAEADMALSGEVFDNDVILSYIKLWHTTNSLVRNHLGRAFEADIADAVLAVTGTAMSFEQRLARMRLLERKMRATHGLLLLYHLNQQAAIHPTLQGAVMDSLGWLDYRKLWFQPIRSS